MAMAQNYQPPKWMVFLLKMIISVGHWYHNFEPNPHITSREHATCGYDLPLEHPLERIGACWLAVGRRSCPLGDSLD